MKILNVLSIQTLYYICPQGVAQVAMAMEIKSHWTKDLGFDSCATLPGNGVNNGHVKTRKRESPTEAYKKNSLLHHLYNTFLYRNFKVLLQLKVNTMIG